MSTTTREERAALAITLRLLEIVDAAFPAGQFRMIDHVSYYSAIGRFRWAASIYVGAIPDARGFRISESSFGICEVTSPSGVATLYNPTVVESWGLSLPAVLVAFQDLAITVANRATRPERGTQWAKP